MCGNRRIDKHWMLLLGFNKKIDQLAMAKNVCLYGWSCCGKCIKL